MLAPFLSFIKLFHLFFLFVWVGTLISLTRLLSMKERNFLQPLKKLYLTLDLPSMCLAILLGLTSCCIKTINYKGGWFHMKLTFVVLLVAIDIFTGRALFKRELKKRSYFIVLHTLVLLFLFLILFSICLLKK